MSRKRYGREEEEAHGPARGRDKSSIWMYSTFVLGVLLVASILWGIPASGSAQEGSPEAVAEKALTFINDNLLQAGTVASLNDVKEESGILLLSLDISGQDIETYATRDGSLLFTSAIDLNSEPAPAPSSGQQTQPEGQVSVDDDPSIGPEDAPVTIIEFSDFQCPYCGRAEPTVKQIIQEYGDSVRLVYRDFPLSFHQNAQAAAEASECADDQGKYWEMHDKLFENQGSLSVDNYKKWAAELGLDTAEFNDCLDSGKNRQEVLADFADGQAAGVTGTPAFFINGKLVSGAQPFSVFKQVIDQELG